MNYYSVTSTSVDLMRLQIIVCKKSGKNEIIMRIIILINLVHSFPISINNNKSNMPN